MLSATTRKVGNSVMISIPKDLTPQSGVDYLFNKTKSGSIVMVPKIDNPYTSDQEFTDADDNEIFETASMKEMTHGQN